MHGASAGADFFLKINEWGSQKKIDVKVQSLKDFAQNSKDVLHEEKIHEFSLQAVSGLQIPVTFYDRNSDVILIAGQGLPASKESMEDFAELFSSYDVILFDYRWNGKYESFLAKAIASANPVKKVLLDETQEVEAVLSFVKNRKAYSKVVGLGECYSNFLFAKVQSDNIKKYGHGPFTHLIFDSCWHSLRLFAERICFDPYLPVSPQKGGAPWLLKAITDSRMVKWSTLWFIFSFMNDISIEPYLSSLHTPVLFVHGLNDLFVPQEHFNKIWDATHPHERAVFFTPYRHSGNLHNKELYRYISEQFVGCESTKEFEIKCAEFV